MTDEPLVIIIVVLAFLLGAVTMIAFPVSEVSLPVVTTRENLDNLKADAYTQGHIDGRGSVYFEDKGIPQNRMGVPEGYISVFNITTAPLPADSSIDDISVANLTFHDLREGAGYACTQNETGHDPNDLVAHIYCREDP